MDLFKFKDYGSIAPDNVGYPENIFLFLQENICFGYSLELPGQCF